VLHIYIYIYIYDISSLKIKQEISPLKLRYKIELIYKSALVVIGMFVGSYDRRYINGDVLYRVCTVSVSSVTLSDAS